MIVFVCFCSTLTVLSAYVICIVFVCFCRMFVRSGMFFRLLAKCNVKTFQHCVQASTVVASGKSRIEPSNNIQRRAAFPVPETVLTQIRRDVLLKAAYQGRVVNKENNCDELLQSEENISDLCVVSMKQRLKVLKQQELIDFIQMLAHATLSDASLNTDTSILEILEDECCLRAKNWDSAILLLVADAFFVMRYRCSHYFSAIFREFEHRWTSMAIGKEDVVQLAMCIVTGRKFPLLLIGNIEKYLNSNMHEFSAGELSVVCSAFFITNTSLGNIEVMEKLSNAVLRDLLSGTLKVYQLCSILKALRHAHFSKLSFYDSLGSSLSRLSKLQHESMLGDLSNIAFTYASLRIASPKLFAGISSNAVMLIQNRTRMRIKDVGRLVWSFALLQEPLDNVVCSQLVFMLRRDVHLMERFSEAFMEALSGLAMMETYPVDLLQKLLCTDFPKQKHGTVDNVVVCCEYCATGF